MLNRLRLRLSNALLQWGRDQLIAEIAPWRKSQKAVRSLQWGRDQLIAEIATILTYSDFKDLRPCLRVAADLVGFDRVLQCIRSLNCSRSCNKSLASGSRICAATSPLASLLTCDKHRIFSNLPVQYACQQPSLNLEQPPVRDTIIEKRMGY